MKDGLREGSERREHRLIGIIIIIFTHFKIQSVAHFKSTKMRSQKKTDSIFVCWWVCACVRRCNLMFVMSNKHIKRDKIACLENFLRISDGIRVSVCIRFGKLVIAFLRETFKRQCTIRFKAIYFYVVSFKTRPIGWRQRESNTSAHRERENRICPLHKMNFEILIMIHRIAQNVIELVHFKINRIRKVVLFMADDVLHSQSCNIHWCIVTAAVEVATRLSHHINISFDAKRYHWHRNSSKHSDYVLRCSVS